MFPRTANVGSNILKRLDHIGIADVAGMDNHIRPPQRRDGLRPQQPVGVRDDADRDPAFGYSFIGWHTTACNFCAAPLQAAPACVSS